MAADQRRLTDSGLGDNSPTWSSDGSQIAFVSERDGNWEVYMMNADGSSPRRLTDNSTADYSPAWQTPCRGP